MPSRVIQLELSQKLKDLRDLAGYENVYAVLRLFGSPIGALSIPCPDGMVKAEALQKAIESDPLIAKHLVNTYLDAFLMQNEPPPALPLPSWSIVVCTRNRTDDLHCCLESLLALQLSHNPPGEIIIVDNAPSDDRTFNLAAAYPIRYVREDRVGLNWARSHGARVANGEIVIFTDDDVVVDPGWVRAILEPFSNPRVAAVTGLTMPLELETKAQELFEVYGGFGRGFYRRAFDYSNMAPAAAGIVGAGANMALRTSLVNQLCLFDVELDSGTVTKTGGDTYAFYQLLAAGYQIVYNPAALVWHRHRREYAELRKTLTGYSVGGYAFLTRCFVQHGDWQALAVGASWFYQDHLHQLARVLLRRTKRLPLSLVIAQIVSVPRGPLAYIASRKREQKIAKKGVKTTQIQGGQP